MQYYLYQFDSRSIEIYNCFLDFAELCGYKVPSIMRKSFYQWIIIESGNQIGGNTSYGSTYGVKISINDAFGIVANLKIVLKVKAVKLNDEYTAEVYKDKVVVDCQTISLDKVREVLQVAESL